MSFNRKISEIEDQLFKDFGLEQSFRRYYCIATYGQNKNETRFLGGSLTYNELSEEEKTHLKMIEALSKGRSMIVQHQF